MTGSCCELTTCAHNPCGAGNTCTDTPAGGYTCTCVAGFFAASATRDFGADSIQSCEPCSAVTNSASVTCTATGDSRAVCNPGFFRTDNSALGASDTCGACDTVPNAVAVTCIALGGSEAVECSAGWSLQDGACVASCSGHSCQGDSVCVDGTVTADPSCVCSTGYYSRLATGPAPRSIPAGWSEGPAPTPPSPPPTRAVVTAPPPPAPPRLPPPPRLPRCTARPASHDECTASVHCDIERTTSSRRIDTSTHQRASNLLKSLSRCKRSSLCFSQ